MSDTKTTNYRTLFIGLGGTGGKVLYELDKLMTPQQKEKAHMIYLDLDKGEASKIADLGVNTVVISSSDTVRDVIGRLGPDDGVNDWIPTADNDKEFLDSKTDDGASQYRLKSRLCLAKFLQNRNNKLAKLLNQLCKVGSTVTNETLRVMIVSSVAGGTGAGTFIQVALYLREFFRNHNHKDISITGLFGCPDLFASVLGDEPGDRANLENMYANAYAAVRELNAMNLAVSTGGLEKIAPGYGKSINISIKTRSEGKIFDPKSDKFISNANNKPFNLLYFVDVTNEDGGLLSSLDQYYKVMADTVHTRLYSPLEEKVRSDESNELATRAKYPTAIYGSVGYGRIRYPYEDIVRYLAVRKTAEEVGYTWASFEDSWKNYCANQQDIATQSGAIWQPTSAARASRFISDMETELKRKNSRTMTLKGMMINPETDRNYAEEYLEALEMALNSGDGLDEAADGIYGLSSDEEVKTAREMLCNSYRNAASAESKANALEVLQSTVGTDKVNLDDYAKKLNKNTDGRAWYMASLVVPQNEQAAENADQQKDSINLLHGLLTVGGKVVHPLAARYLLYQLRKGLQDKVKSYGKEDVEVALRQQIDSLNLVFDKRPDDGRDITVETKLAELEKTFVWFRDAEAAAALDIYAKKLKSILSEMMIAATNNLKAMAYTKILEYVEALVAQYEGLFDNLQQYKLMLDENLRQERVRNNSSADDRCIYVDATAEAKEFRYERDPLTRNALLAGDGDISAAAGRGIYDALLGRVWAKLASQKNQNIMGYYAEEEEDTYSDLGGIFDGIVEIYSTYLKDKATHLNVTVVDALVNQSCLEEGINRSDLKDVVKRRIVRGKMEEIVWDMIAKSTPMLAYDNHNADTYYQSEAGGTETKPYMYMGMHPASLKGLTAVYDGDSQDSSLKQFEDEFKPGRGLTESTEIDPYTITCFSAVHCLQPTQILKFREDFDGGYYQYYKARLAMISATGCLSFTPHLDKRWHLREAMPYISRSMELKWHKKTTKAFIYEMLQRKFTFTTTGDGIKCFNYLANDNQAPIFVNWPAGQLVTVGNISRLVDYLEEQDERVERLNKEFDELIDNILTVLVKYNDSMPTYKAALTNNPKLKLLRENLCEAFDYTSTTTATRGKKSKTSKKKESAERIKAYQAASRALGSDESVASLLDIKNTLGGLLQVAWMVHKSEELQSRDKDYGEAILDCALELAEKLCQTMCGKSVAADTAADAEYKDLYNSILEKFMEAYVKGQLAQRKLLSAEKLEDMDSSLFYRYLKVPACVSKTLEYRWIVSKWTLK